MTDARECANLALMMVCLVFAGGAGAGAADAPRTGDFTLAFTENSPLTTWREASSRIFTEEGPQTKEPGGEHYALGEEPFALHVPKDYDGSRAYGLVAYAPPAPGGAASAEFAEVCDRHHLIWMGATRFSEQRSEPMRARILADGVYNLVRQYRIDPERLYIADQRARSNRTCGFASRAVMGYPDVYTGGALFLNGVLYYRPMLRDAAMANRLLEQARKLRFAFVADSEAPHGVTAQNTGDCYAHFRELSYPFVKLINQAGLYASNAPSPQSFAAAVEFVDAPIVDRARDALATGAKLEAAKKYREALASYAAALDCVADQTVADAAREHRRKVIATLDPDAAKELAPLLAKPQAAGLRAFVAKWPAELPSVASARAAAEPLGAEEWAKVEAAKPTAPALRTFIKSWGGYDAAKPAIAALDAFAQLAWGDFEKLKPGAPRTRALARFPDQWDGTPTGAHARELLGKEVVDEINEIRQLPEDVQITRLQALFAELRGSKLGKDIDARLDELEKAQQAKAKAGKQ